ncbi:helix-turn-helix domain-containing protein [Candidatus Daviesbacteria bacterium]|nr:helix-turn-helix domain-containing protein [Candidatus Daviesbacteria bacterium]
MQEWNGLYSVREAAEFLHVSPKTIRTWAQKTKLKGIKIGPRGDWRFTKEELLKMIHKK